MGEATCAICLQDLASPGWSCQELPCKHKFHEKCKKYLGADSVEFWRTMVAHAHVEHFHLSGTTNMENYRSRGKHAEVKWNIGLGRIASFGELLVVGRHVLWQIALCGHSRKFFFDQSVLEGAQAFPHATLLRFEEGSITKNENLTVWSTNAGPVPVADILQSICLNLMAHGVFELKHEVDVHPDKYGSGSICSWRVLANA